MQSQKERTETDTKKYSKYKQSPGSIFHKDGTRLHFCA